MNLSLKEKGTKEITTQKTFVDPFENPPTNELFIGTISETHSLLFNKFNLLENHLLIVTNIFEKQESLLTLQDFESFWECVDGLDMLGFFNCGPHSGASQPHKHFQLLPLPLTDEEYQVPIERILLSDYDSMTCTEWKFTSNTLPFRNYTCFIPAETTSKSIPEGLECLYHQFVQQFTKEFTNTTSYNILLTKRWIMFIPRKVESFQTVAGNATAFAGTLFVKTLEQQSIVESLGPMKIVSQLGFDVKQSQL